jgi:CheY-like chemotaxis protein/HPt (histidine-containing phosphotransfer) domain-containing protein
VVEDTEINAEVTVKLLNDINIACDTVSDGIEAVKICKSKGPDHYNVILMDIHMPKMDGYTAASIIKKELGLKTPIVALTASDINDQTRSEHADTIESFILKPFKVEAFYNAISPYFPLREMAPARTGLQAQRIIKSSEDTENTPNERDPFAGREEAIKNMGGIESIYNKHIKKFKVNYAASTEHIVTLLEEKNYDEARRLAHSIKGLGGTLGMIDVMESSAELEKAILKGEDYDLQVELENFDRDLKAAISAIN